MTVTYKRNGILSSLFQLRGSVIKDTYPFLLGSLLCSLTACLIWEFTGWWAEGLGQAIVLSLFIVPIGFLLIFRTNIAYDRYWEGRMVIHTLTTTTQSFVRKSVFYASGSGQDKVMGARISRCLVRLLNIYFDNVKHSLSQQNIACYRRFVHPAETEALEATLAAEPITITYWISRILALAHERGFLDAYTQQDMDMHTEELIGAWMGGMKIKATPIPFPYVQLLQWGLLVTIVIIPFGFVGIYTWWTMAIAPIITLAFTGINWASIEIQDPFGTDANDFELGQYAESIHATSRSILYTFYERTMPGFPEDWLDPGDDSVFRLIQDLADLTLVPKKEPDQFILNPDYQEFIQKDTLPLHSIDVTRRADQLTKEYDLDHLHSDEEHEDDDDIYNDAVEGPVIVPQRIIDENVLKHHDDKLRRLSIGDVHAGPVPLKAEGGVDYYGDTDLLPFVHYKGKEKDAASEAESRKGSVDGSRKGSVYSSRSEQCTPLSPNRPPAKKGHHSLRRSSTTRRGSGADNIFPEPAQKHTEA